MTIILLFNKYRVWKIWHRNTGGNNMHKAYHVGEKANLWLFFQKKGNFVILNKTTKIKNEIDLSVVLAATSV